MSRDTAAFAEFVSACSPALHRAAYLMVGEGGLAQDLVQETLTKTYVAWPRLRDQSRAEAYTRKAITTTAIGWFRRKRWYAERRGAGDPPPETAGPGHADGLDQRTWLWECLQQLPIRQRVAIVLRYYEDLTEAQTAAAMGCAVGTVKSQVAAGLDKLRAQVGDLLLPEPRRARRGGGPMTETLKTVLDREASSVAFAPPDVDAITGAGRRRGPPAAGGRPGLTGVVAVALVRGGAVVMGDGGDGESVVASGDGSGAAVSWAVGSTIHVGDDTIEVGHPIRAYVRTSAGFVVLDGVDNVWSVTDDGVTEIGRMTSLRPDNLDKQLLASDPRGSLAGWVGEDLSGDLIVETYDQETGESRSFPVPGARPPDDSVFFAIDDRTGYWRTPTGVVAVDLDSGRERQEVRITDDRVYDFEVYSVENGMIAFTPQYDEVILAGRSVEGARELLDFRSRPSGPRAALADGCLAEPGRGRGRHRHRGDLHDRQDHARGLRRRHRRARHARPSRRVTRDPGCLAGRRHAAGARLPRCHRALARRAGRSPLRVHGPERVVRDRRGVR